MTNWIVAYQDSHVTVVFTLEGTYKVVIDGKSKTFKGETAWSDAQRYLLDKGLIISI